MAENQDTKNGGGAPPGGASGAPGASPGAGRPNGKRRGRKGVLIPLLILVALALLGGGYWYVRLRGVISTDDAYVDGDRVAVSTKVSGRITMLGTDEGDTVQAGQLLVQLDDSDLQAREAETKTGLALAQENVKLAAARLSQASDDYKRAEVQFKGHAVSQEALDHARTALTMARVQHSIALAQVEKARAALNTVETQIQDTRVDAPSYGVVAKRWVLPGDVVQPGQPIFTLYDLKNVWVTANFEETKLASIPVGAVVDISVDAFPRHHFVGRVVRLGAATASQFSLIPPNNASGNFTKVTQRVPVRISIAPQSNTGDDPPTLLPGMSVEVTVRHPAK
ncbi:MAG: HlyD family secretion protein [Gemmatimonadota bacterium]|jgi:membrane fusion protein (multidrug efflux system)